MIHSSIRVLATIVVFSFCLGGPLNAQSFGTVANYGVATIPSAIAVGDFNGDQAPDLAVAGCNFGVQILFNSGSGPFSVISTVFSGIQIDLLKAVDLDMDGDLDLVAGKRSLSSTGSSVINTFLNNGVGVLTFNTTVFPGPVISQVAVGDLNGDGRPELAMTFPNNDGFAIFTNSGFGIYSLANSVAYNLPAGSEPRGIAIEDLDGNGMQDLIIGRYNGSNPGDLYLLSNIGGPLPLFSTSPPATIVPVGNSPLQVKTADLNADGIQDIVSANQSFGPAPASSIAVLIASPSVPFAYAMQAYHDGMTLSAGDLTFADFDIDGDVDIMTSNFTNSGPRLSFFANDGSGCFDPAGCNPGVILNSGVGITASVPNFGFTLAAADFNQDGACDIAFASSIVAQVQVLPNIGQVTGTYPGGQTDIRLSTAAFPLTSPEFVSSGPANDVKNVAANEHIVMHIDSPGGTKNYTPYALIGQFKTTGSVFTQALGFPDAWMDTGATPGPFIILDGNLFGNPSVLLPAGVSFSVLYPGGLSGLTLLVQGFSLTANAANGNAFFSSTDAHALILN